MDFYHVHSFSYKVKYLSCTCIIQDSSFYGDDVPKGDAMCKFFYCSDGGNYCSSLISSDGLLCGAGKTCLEGSCVTDTFTNNTGVDGMLSLHVSCSNDTFFYKQAQRQATTETAVRKRKKDLSKH